MYLSTNKKNVNQNDIYLINVKYTRDISMRRNYASSRQMYFSNEIEWYYIENLERIMLESPWNATPSKSGM